MSIFSKLIGLDKYKDLERTLNALIAGLIPHVLTGKAGKIQAWADEHGVDAAALDELVRILTGDDDAPVVTVAATPPAPFTPSASPLLAQSGEPPLLAQSGDAGSSH